LVINPAFEPGFSFLTIRLADEPMEKSQRAARLLGDRLMRFLTTLGCHIEIKIGARQETKPGTSPSRMFDAPPREVEPRPWRCGRASGIRNTSATPDLIRFLPAKAYGGVSPPGLGRYR
jgi:hypothetical protein